MNIDYEPMWAVVDAHRHAADELEAALREATGDRPEPKVEVDKPHLYSLVLGALEDAQITLREIADREGHSITRQHASKCRVIVRRCSRAADELEKAVEL
jgi:hypothetical protein